MIHFRRHPIVATGVLALAALTSCAGNPSGGSTPGSPETESTSAPAPSKKTDSEIASEATVTLVKNYLAALDNLRQDPKSSVDELETYAVGTELTAQTGLLRREHKAGQRQTGTTKVTKVVADSIDLSAEPATAFIAACWDVSGVDVLDRSGESIVSPSRPETGGTSFTVTKTERSASVADGWRVSSSKDLGDKACAAS